MTPRRANAVSNNLNFITMKKIFVFFSLLVISFYSYAQNPDILKLPVPHFKILKADSTYTDWTALNKNKPVMIIYFAPDCSHCQHLMSEMKEDMEPFKNLQLVMITYTKTEYPFLNMIRDFSRNYTLPKYKNIVMGTEHPADIVMKYYHVEATPFIAFYDRTGKMTQYFDKPAKKEELAAAAKKADAGM